MNTKKSVLVIVLGALAGNVIAWTQNPETAFTAGNILWPSFVGAVPGLVSLLLPRTWADYIKKLLD